MKPLSKLCTFILMGALIVSTLTLAESANAQTLAPPEYTLENVGNAFLVIIKNQAFTPYIDEHGFPVKLYYSVSYYEETWNGGSRWVEQNSSLEYTTVKFSCWGPIPAGNLYVSVQPVIAAENATEMGCEHPISNMIQGLPLTYIHHEYNTISSGNNRTKSIIIPPHTDAPISTPAPSSTSPVYPSGSSQQDNSAQQDNSFFNDALNISWDFDWETAVLAVMAVVIAVLSLGMIGLWRRTGKLMQNNRPA